MIARLGAGRTTVAAGFAIAAGLALRALPQTLVWFAVAQFLAGLADGVSDVSMNVEAVAVDARARVPIVNRLHAVWSMGAVAGGLLGDWNWWLPKWLDRLLPNLDIEAGAGLPEPEFEDGYDPHAEPEREPALVG